MVEERWLSDLNISSLYDNDTASCLDFTRTTNVITLRLNTLLQGYFYVIVILPENLEADRHSIIRVLTLEDITETGNSCPRTKEFRKCRKLEGPEYVCFCRKPCEVSVKVSFVSEWLNANEPKKVCEIILK